MNIAKPVLSYILEATTPNKSSRPILEYAYYLSNTKKLVATDAFRLHEVEIDLGDEDFCIDKQGNKQPVQGKFPDYNKFFPDTSIPTLPMQVDLKVLKQMPSLCKPISHHTILSLANGSLRTMQSSTPSDFTTYDIRMKPFTFPQPNDNRNEQDIGINVEYLYQALRYSDSPHSLKYQSKNALVPFIIHHTIGYCIARTLIMPLKLS